MVDHEQQLERAWQLMLGARRDLEHANKVAAEKALAFDRANAHLLATLNAQPAENHDIADEHIVARILEVA